MNNIIRDAIKRYASNKEEIWEEPSDWERSPEYQQELKRKLEPLPDLLVGQIPAVFLVLNEELQKQVVKSTEDARMVVGKKMSRFNKLYNTFFMRKTLDYFIEDPEGGQVVIGKYLKEYWDDLKTNIFPYNPKTGERLEWVRSLAIQADQNVYLVKDNKNTSWVVKWEGGGTETEMKEEKHYNTIERLGGTVPERLKGYYVLGISVLVLEYLEALDITDNPIEVGRQLIGNQLKYIHVFGLHNDLKPDNIRKRRGGDPPTYFIIDMDLDTTPMPGGTFRRNHWTPFYHSQPFVPLDISYGSYRADFIELGSVMNQMIAARNYRLKMGPYRESDSLKHRKKSLGLLESDLYADVETMRDYYYSTERTEPIPFRVARVMDRIAKSYDMVGNMLVATYWRYVTALPERDMPANVHDTIAMNILVPNVDTDYYMKETMDMIKQRGIECSVCNTNIAENKCISCWKETYLCKNNGCISTHVCSNKRKILGE